MNLRFNSARAPAITIKSPLIAFSLKDRVSSKNPLLSGIMLPEMSGCELFFRPPKRRETGHLKKLYQAAWNNNRFSRKKPIKISKRQIRAMMDNFPEGQIVGVERGLLEFLKDTHIYVLRNGIGAVKNEAIGLIKREGLVSVAKKAIFLLKRKKPISMVNIMLTVYDPEKGFTPGYENATGGRTFSTSIPPRKLFAYLENNPDASGVALCVSIAVSPKHAKGGYAKETLNYAKVFAVPNGLVACPYSAPRGFAKAREKNPDLDIMDYLHMTVPTARSFEEHIARFSVLSPILIQAFGDKPILSRKIFEKYQGLPKDDVAGPMEKTAYQIFLQQEGKELAEKLGVPMTIELFCALTGRRILDPVIGMHVSNGAFFIRDENNGIEEVYENSRPEDLASLGYNIVLSYGLLPARKIQKPSSYKPPDG